MSTPKLHAMYESIHSCLAHVKFRSDRIFGMSMPLCGFMLVPSLFPAWLRWSYHVPFHTYAWRSFVYNEFVDAPSGPDVLETYEIEDTSLRNDMAVLFCYGLVS